MSGETTQLILSRVQGARPLKRGWLALCPAHRDRQPSLSIGVGDDGRTLLHCFAACEPAAIVHALGLTMGDLFAGSTPRPVREPRPLSPIAEARRDIFAEAMRRKARLLPYIEGYFRADQYREVDREIERARQQATALGPDSEQAWALAVAAADLELALNNAECGA